MTNSTVAAEEAEHWRNETIRHIALAMAHKESTDMVIHHHHVCSALVCNGFAASYQIKSETDPLRRFAMETMIQMGRDAEMEQDRGLAAVHAEYRKHKLKSGRVRAKHEKRYDEDLEQAAFTSVLSVWGAFLKVSEFRAQESADYQDQRPTFREMLERIRVRGAAWKAAREAGATRREADQAAAQARNRAPVSEAA